MKLKRYMTLALASLLVVCLCGCGLMDKLKGDKDKDESSKAEETESDPGYPVSAGGITLKNRPDAVVSLAPSLTEKIYDLGMDSRLAGVSDYCDFPTEVMGLPFCGTSQLPDLDKLEALEPGLVVSDAELPAEAMATLDDLGIPVAVLPRAESVNELMDSYLTLARLIDGDNSGYEIGDDVVKEYRARLKSLNNALASYTKESGRKKVLYLRLMDFTVATGGTFENELMDTACLDNIASSYTRWSYPEEAAKAADGAADFAALDIIYMDQEFVTIKDLEGSAFYKGLPATIKDRYLYISSLELERQSFRSLDVLEAMAKYAYPDANFSSGGGGGEPADEPDDDEDMADA